MSNRRLKYFAFGALALLAAVVFQPSRQWLVQRVVWKFVNPDLSIKNLTIRPRSSVVVVDGIQWSRRQGDRTLSVDVKRAWIAQRPEPLLYGRISIAGVQLDDIRLTMKTDTSRPQSTPRAWNSPSLPTVARVDMKTVAEDFASLAAAESVHQKWRERIDAWIEQSQGIASAIEDISSSASLDSNPLRNETGLQQALANVDKLIEQQQQLRSHFDGVCKLLMAESNQLRQSFESEIDALELTPANGLVVPAAQQVAQTLMFELATSYWLDFSPYAEVAYAIDEIFHQERPRPSYDRDFFTGGQSVELLGLDNIAAEGVFCCAEREAPFSLRGSYAVHTHALHSETRQSEFQFRFTPSGVTATVAVNQEKHPLDSRLIQLEAYACQENPTALPSEVSPSEVSPSAASPSDASVPTITCTDKTITGEPVAKFRLHASQEVIEGVLQISAINVQRTGQTAHWFREAVGGLDSQAARFDVNVEGTWSEPRFEMTGNVPEELIAAIDGQLKADSGSSATAIAMRIREEFTSKLNQINTIVTLASTTSTSIVNVQARQLEQVRQALQDRLNEISGSSFARRPASVTNR